MDPTVALQSIVDEVHELLPAGAVVVDAHTHLGRDEDGQALDRDGLLAALDEVGPTARACTFALHDPDRAPAYRVPNDRVLHWAEESGGRLYPYCRLDPADDPVAEAERCLALGARGIKLHPRAQAFGFGNAAAESIWKVAEAAKVPILIHAGRGMPRMDPLADLALRFPDVVLVLAHAAIADQGMFASRLRDHPNVVYDTSTFSVFDQLELFARVPAERIVFASDVPYGRPLGALYTALRMGLHGGLDDGRAQAPGRRDHDRRPRRAAACRSEASEGARDPSHQRPARASQRLHHDVVRGRDRLRSATRLRPGAAVHRACPSRVPRPRPGRRGARDGTGRRAAGRGRADARDR